MKPKVSIIVPIFNMEKYLDRCLNSLTSQTLKEIEIIAVNDGSTDSSLAILNQYAQMDKRIKVINKENNGVSSARNKGLLNASGDYIGFVDPDDWVNGEMYKSLYETAVQETVDIVMCSYIREFGSHSKVKDFNHPAKVYTNQKDVRNKILRRLVGPLNEEVGNPELLDAWGTVWCKLYQVKLLKENKVFFKDLKEIGTNEDTLFNIYAFYYANSFAFINKPFYHYWRVNEQSVTTGYKPDLFKQWSNLFTMIESFLKEKNMDPSYFQALNNRICLGTLGLGLNTISKSNKSTVRNKVQKIKGYLDADLIKHSFKQLELSSFPIVWKVFYFCAKARLALGMYFLLVGVDGLRKIRR
jgi:glycosyltransferase involved in cell wall biosynthesis